MAKKEEKEEEKDAPAEGAEGEQTKKKFGLKKILIIVVPIVLLLGGGAGAYFMGYLDSLLGIEKPAEEGEEAGDEHAEEGKDSHGKEDSHAKDEKAEKKDAHAKKEDDGHGKEGGKEGEHGAVEDDSAFLPIPTMIVNLNSEDGNPRYLRLTVQLELEDPTEKADVQSAIPRVIDQFQTYLRELRVQDLRGSAGIYRLQVELLWRVNQAVSPIQIKDVLFQEILIQ